MRTPLENLRYLMTRWNIDRGILARLLGVHRRVICSWLSGDVESDAAARRLMQVLYIVECSEPLIVLSLIESIEREELHKEQERKRRRRSSWEAAKRAEQADLESH